MVVNNSDKVRPPGPLPGGAEDWLMGPITVKINVSYCYISFLKCCLLHFCSFVPDLTNLL